MTSNEKGKELEWAIQWLEEHIAERQAVSHTANRTIQVNKHIKVAGVRHEIDVWVEEIRDIPPNFVYIFECKNWKKKVGKKVLPDFAKKIEDVGATHGFLVAPGFTKDAENLAKQYNRLTLLRADTDPSKLLSRIYASFTTIKINNLSLTVSYRDTRLNQTIENTTATLSGQLIDLNTYCHGLAAKQAQSVSKSDNKLIMLSGNHRAPINLSYSCHRGELIIDGHDVNWFSIEGSFSYLNQPFTIERFYNVETRGYVSSFGGVHAEGIGKVSMDVAGKL